jgi:hypothetical protein
MHEYAKEANQSNMAGRAIGYPNYAAGQSGANLGEVKAASPVESALHSLEDSTASLHKILSELERRLCMVLGPQETGKDVPPEPNPVPTVAARIGASGRSVSNACSRIGEMLHRLEL